MHTIDGCQYDSLKAHIIELFDSTGLLKLFLEQTVTICEIGKFKVVDLPSDLHIHDLSMPAKYENLVKFHEFFIDSMYDILLLTKIFSIS